MPKSVRNCLRPTPRADGISHDNLCRRSLLKEMLFKRITAVVLCVVMIGCSLANFEAATVYAAEKSPFEVIAESANMRLYLDKKKAMLRLEHKPSGRYMDTKEMEGQSGNASVKNRQKSDLRFNYIATEKSKNTLSTTTYDTYSLSLQLGGVTFENIDNGVRIFYEVGEVDVTYNDFPLYITEERMNELVYQYLSITDKELINTTYYRLSQGVYIRRSNKDTPLGKLAARELYEYFYETGEYTYEELEADNYEFGVETEQAHQHISAYVDYVLDGDDLVVRVPVSEIEYLERYPIQSIDVLPYFMTSGAEDNGYLFVPDGSGALIRFNNAKVNEYSYTTRYFNGDILMGATTPSEAQYAANMPVFGINYGDYGLLGIVEEGAEVAELSTAVSGVNDEFNRIGVSFYIRDIDVISPPNVSNYSVSKFSDDDYRGNIVVRYKFLSGDQAGYSGMAMAYRNYLTSNGTLQEVQAQQDAPLFVELLGAIKKTRFFLGVPYQGIQTLTTFKQAQSILTSINSNGINNIKLQYSGTVNGGLSQTSAGSVNVIGKLGGKSGLTNFANFARGIGADVFPTVMLQTAYTDKGLSTTNKSSFLSGETAQIYDFDKITGKADAENKNPLRIIAPTYIASYINKFIKSFDKVGVSNLASTDFGSFIAGDYARNKNISITNAASYYREAMQQLSKYQLMLSNPMQYTYPDVDLITDLPTTSNRFKVLDEDVPFIQMVLDGCIPYSTEAINNKSLDITPYFLRAIETKSSPKFKFTYENADALKNSDYNDLFLTEYAIWQDQMSAIYGEYNAFYQKVKDAHITNHTIVNQDIRKVEYSNGVTVYVNYGHTDAQVDGLTVAAQNYGVREGK